MREENACPSLLAELADALHARCLVVIRAYADESEKSDLGVFTVAGYVFTPSACGPFERQWRRALESGPRRLSEFKTSDFMGGWNEFEGWTERERIALYKSLSKITYTYGLSGFSVSVDCHLLSTLCPRENPYSLAAAVFVQRILRYTHDSRPVAYFFDGGRKGLGRLEYAFRKIKNHPRKYEKLNIRIDSYARVDSKTVPQLQAADMIAWRTAWEAAMKLGRPTGSVTDFSDTLISRTKTLRSRDLILTGDDLRSIYMERRFPPFDE